MRAFNFLSNSAEHKESLEGYVYDISINTIKIGLLAFGDKGIFRSKPKEISNCVSFNLEHSAVIPSIMELRDSYIQDYLILSENVLIEAYGGLKVYDSFGGLLINQLIPLPDSLDKQTEYIDPVGRDFRFKLFL